jgi:hypothetical protein
MYWQGFVVLDPASASPGAGFFRSFCTLCRHRHNVHYAELRIMPTSAAKPAWEAVIAVKEAA